MEDSSMDRWEEIRKVDISDIISWINSEIRIYEYTFGSGFDPLTWQGFSDLSKADHRWTWEIYETWESRSGHMR
jgi:hypothetical protein